MANEDTQDIEVKVNETLISEMLRDVEKAEVDSDLRRNPVIHKGDGDLPAPMTVSKISGAGYVWIYDTRTGEKVPVIYYMLPSKLRQRRQDGSFRFTTNDPGVRPKVGTVKCLLHKDGENRKHYDELGFRVCNKENITNKYQLDQHMKHKHSQEWAAIQDEKTKKEKDEDRALQRLLIASQLGDKVKETLPPNDEPEKPTEERTMQNEKPLGANEYVCAKCGGAVHRVTSKLGKRHLKYKK